MKISSLEEYGLRCLIQVARAGDGPTPISVISGKEGLSIEYVGKLLMRLRRGGLVKSFRGKTGGYVLAHPAEEITLRQILETLSEPLFNPDSPCDRFPGPGDECVHLGGCTVRPIWATLSNFLSAALDSVSLSDLADGQTRSETKLRQGILVQAKKLADRPDFDPLPTI